MILIIFIFFLKELECKLFKEVVGNNFVGAQVEDVFGTNQLMLTPAEPVKPVRSQFGLTQDVMNEDGLGLYTPEIIADDCSSVFLIVNYKM